MPGYPIILAADDDENDLFFLRRAFHKANLAPTLITAHDGQEAINYLSGDRAQFPLPNLMLLDIKMPCVNGFEVLDWLQTRPDLKPMPVVMLTSSNEPEDKKRAFGAGAWDYKIKPAATEDLVALVQELANRWLTEPVGPAGWPHPDQQGHSGSALP
ncbi:MAG TPA: response regulator [Candidatus Sulfotelmatobacter sp.]|nr:response regulator [Candidatus Sulfotelmatobacter sp.]